MNTNSFGLYQAVQDRDALPRQPSKIQKVVFAFSANSVFNNFFCAGWCKLTQVDASWCKWLGFGMEGTFGVFELADQVVSEEFIGLVAERAGRTSGF